MKAKKWSRKRKILTAAILGSGLIYGSLTARVLPYLANDLRAKRGTEQLRLDHKLESATEIGKDLTGAFVWFPYHRVKSMLEGKKEYLFIVNKETQQLYIFDRDGTLEQKVPVSTGKKVSDDKRLLDDRVTPPGEYIAVRSFNKQELRDWFGKKKAEEYGDGMLLFMGRWFPNIAIHGVPSRLERLLGKEASRGCPRVDAGTISWINQHTAIGSRMQIHPYGVIPIQVEDLSSIDQYLNRDLGIEAATEQFLNLNPHITNIDDVKKGGIYFVKAK